VIRTASLAATDEGGSALVETVDAKDDPGLSSFVENTVARSNRPELTAARAVVSGGRLARRKSLRR